LILLLVFTEKGREMWEKIKGRGHDSDEEVDDMNVISDA